MKKTKENSYCKYAIDISHLPDDDGRPIEEILKEWKEAGRLEPYRMKTTVYVVENINGDIMGVADSMSSAINIFEQKYGETPEEMVNEDPDRFIKAYTLNEFYYQ